MRKIEIATDLPGFTADIADVLRIFWGEFEAAPGGDRLCHTHGQVGDQWVETCRYEGEGRVWTHTLEALAMVGRLEEKRFLKRALKRCCYGLLKQVTGMQPPWGSLTGIRPTRLFYEALEGGEQARAVMGQLETLYDIRPDKAALLAEVVRSQAGLVGSSPAAIDIYVGIPFCTTRCAYCSFAAGEIGKGTLVAPYLVALAQEIAATQALVEAQRLQVGALYIGGGTPTALSRDQLEQVVAQLAAAFPSALEFTVEAGRPDTLDADKLRMLKGYPVTRISINPQTMHDSTLARIGRAHTARQTLEAFALARKLGFDHINMDVICALPGETPGDFAHTLGAIQALGPESLTVHTLALKRASKLRTVDYTPTDAQAAQAMVEMGQEAAHRMGMKAYYLYRQKYMAGNLENVGYAKPGCACRYNIDIMEETTSILAVGAGAISKRVFDREKRIERAPNVSNIEIYIQRVQEMIGRKEALWSGIN